MHARNLHKYANEKYAIYVHNMPKICMKIQLYADMCEFWLSTQVFAPMICLGMYCGLYWHLLCMSSGALRHGCALLALPASSFARDALGPAVEPSPLGSCIWSLGSHDFRYDFTIMFIHMNSYMSA